MWNTDPYNFDAIEFAKVMEEYNPKFFKTFMDNKTTKSGVIDAITKGL
jgi:ribosomal protein S17E